MSHFHNDTYGHSGGDKVLQHFAQILKDNLRQVDVIGRVGGEEFAVILPQTILKSFGYTVTSTNAPIQVFELLQERPDQFDLVVTDMTMRLSFPHGPADVLDSTQIT